MWYKTQPAALGVRPGGVKACSTLWKLGHGRNCRWKREPGSLQRFPGLQQFCCRPKAAWSSGAPPFCGTLLLSPSLLLSLSGWCSVELLPELDLQQQQQLSRGRREQAEGANALPGLLLTAGLRQPLPPLPRDIHKSLGAAQVPAPRLDKAEGTAKGSCNRVSPPFPQGKGQIPLSHVPFLPKDAETQGLPWGCSCLWCSPDTLELLQEASPSESPANGVSAPSPPSLIPRTAAARGRIPRRRRWRSPEFPQLSPRDPQIQD